jgi:hypothetical protein
MKRVLIEQAGEKCANPGCPNRLVELHHIREWHVYQTHDAEHMIALCAACHDSVDRGQLQISDEALYRWKGIDRRGASHTGHIFVEPGGAPRLLLGSITLQGNSGIVVFDFSKRQRLSFAVRDSEIMLLNVKISDPAGNLLLDVVDGYVRKREPSIELRTRPGAVEVPVEFDSQLIPGWVRAALLREDDRYGEYPLSLLAMEVIDRGLVRVEGLWLDTYNGVVITRERLSFVSRGRPRPVTLVGEGEKSIINYVGPIDASVFGLGSGSAIVVP